mgnify:CR=1 FL=1
MLIKLYLENWAKTSNTRNVYLDGELYNHDLKLNEISSIVMKKRDLNNDEKNTLDTTNEDIAIENSQYDINDPSSPNWGFYVNISPNTEYY